MARLKQDIAGNAGVMFVAGELGRHGIIALPTVRNTEGIDLVASEPGGKSVSIQVKTRQRGEKKWLLSKKNESISSETMFYVFVSLGLPGELPEYHVVPSAIVAKAIRESHQTWLATPGKKGQAHNDSSMRDFWDVSSKYKDNWSVLGLKLVP